MEKNPSSSRTDRKTIEKNRRNHMKALYSKLGSLVPHQNSRNPASLPDQLREATNYIKKLQMNLMKMKEKKDILMEIDQKPRMFNMDSSNKTMVGLKSPQIEIHEMGSVLEIVLITGLDCQYMFNESIRVLHEEGADIINASFSIVEDTVFHTIHSKVGETGHEVARISERLKKFVPSIHIDEYY
ncbi:transcription factor bHLH36 [Quillaja saponaria]|uniref:Transcription factor bHLH36 n=1 Tax=Quillaja saponaria TaxID=32244 RepID=A0AAD7M239_QUISA|nr:transcription factor bHLH36 [Quillaja saponaria]